MVSNHPSSQGLRHFKQTGMPVCSTYSGFMRLFEKSAGFTVGRLEINVIFQNNKITKFAAFSGGSPISLI